MFRPEIMSPMMERICKKAEAGEFPKVASPDIARECFEEADEQISLDYSLLEELGYRSAGTNGIIGTTSTEASQKIADILGY